jgi:hypothetical protein
MSSTQYYLWIPCAVQLTNGPPVKQEDFVATAVDQKLSLVTPQILQTGRRYRFGTGYTYEQFYQLKAQTKTYRMPTGEL